MTDFDNVLRQMRRKRGRPPVRKEAVEEYVRELIVSGRLKPGDAVPTRRALAAQFDASPVTVQAAATRLVREGFLNVRGQKGTFVAQTPPHTSRYAVVMPVTKDEVEKNRFWKALALETEKAREQEGLDIKVYYDVDGRAASSDELELIEDVARRRLAGIIFASAPFNLRNSPVLTGPRISRVAIMTPAKGYPGLSMLQMSGFERAAVSRMLASGRRRVAVLCTPGVEEKWERRIVNASALLMRRSWLQSVSQSAPSSARRCMWLLMDTARPERPDGLIITDDNLVESATLGLKEWGVRVPEELLIVAHCNFPWLPRTHVGVEWVGYDARHVLRTALEDLHRQRCKSGAPRRLRVGAICGNNNA